MKIDWKKVWKPFNKECGNFLVSWEKKLIQSLVEKQLKRKKKWKP